MSDVAVDRTTPGWRVDEEWDTALREWADRRGWPLYVAYELVVEEWVEENRHAEADKELADWLDDAGLSLGDGEKNKKFPRAGETRPVSTAVREELLGEFKATAENNRFGAMLTRAVREFLTRPSEDRMAEAVAALREYYQDDPDDPETQTEDEAVDLPDGVTPGSEDGKTIRMAHRLGPTFVEGDLYSAIVEVGGDSDHYFDTYEDRVIAEKGAVEHPVKDWLYIPEEQHEETIASICDRLSPPCTDPEIRQAIAEEFALDPSEDMEDTQDKLRAYTPIVRDRLEEPDAPPDTEPEPADQPPADEVREELNVLDAGRPEALTQGYPADD